MANKTIVSPLDEHKGRILNLALLGASFGLSCILFITAFIGFQPDQFSLSDRYFPSPTPTSTGTPTRTPTITLTPTITNTPTATLIPTRTHTATMTLTPTVTLTGTPNEATQQALKEAFEATAVVVSQDWQPVFSETFEKDQNQWPTGSQDDDLKEITYKVVDDRYRLNIKAHKKFIGLVDIPTTSVRNFYFSAEVRQVRGAVRTDYGFIFRRDSNGNYYYFGMNDLRQYTVRRFYNNEWSALIDWTSSAAIKHNDSSELSVIAEDDHFRLFINDQFVAEIHDELIQEGTFALAFQLHAVGHVAFLEFDNIELRVP